MNTNEAPPAGGKDENARESMQLIARMIDNQLPDGWGFALLVFPFNAAPGRCNYIANGRREDIIKEMKAWIARAEQAKTDQEFFKHHKQ